jgi:predicted house-cleaning noncanonical NTP pyrophosphatase (MazG superfamily)
VIRYDKLVRDRIPQIIAAAGDEPEVRRAAPEEYRPLLRRKLLEEVDEFLAGEDVEELADVLEVVHALAADLGVTPERLEQLRAEKAAARGAFTDRLVLVSVVPAAGGMPESSGESAGEKRDD